MINRAGLAMWSNAMISAERPKLSGKRRKLLQTTIADPAHGFDVIAVEIGNFYLRKLLGKILMNIR